MSRLLEQLEDRSCVMLMYLAGELPVEDRAEVERRLVADLALRDELLDLREGQETVLGGLARLDEATPLPADESAAVRDASRAIRQWHTRRLSTPGPRRSHSLENSSARRWRVWAVPSAAAALVLVVVGLTFHREFGKRHPVVVNQRRSDKPAVPTPKDGTGRAVGVPAATSTGTPAVASADSPAVASDVSDDELVSLFNVKADDVLASADHDGPREDPAGREDVADVRPVFDIPLDPG